MQASRRLAAVRLTAIEARLDLVGHPGRKPFLHHLPASIGVDGVSIQSGELFVIVS